MENWKDRNVQRVAESLKERMEKGFIKYGTTTERNDLNTLEWLQHLQEELLDAAVYVERLKQDLKQVESFINLNDNMNNSFTSYGDTITITSAQPTGQDVSIDLGNYGAAQPVIGIDPITCDMQNEFPSSYQVSPVIKKEDK
jgi:hypothetical protein